MRIRCIDNITEDGRFKSLWTIILSQIEPTFSAIIRGDVNILFLWPQVST